MLYSRLSSSASPRFRSGGRSHADDTKISAPTPSAIAPRRELLGRRREMKQTQIQKRANGISGPPGRRTTFPSPASSGEGREPRGGPDVRREPSDHRQFHELPNVPDTVSGRRDADWVTIAT